MKNRSSLIRLHWNSANLKQGAHIHQPTAGPLPHARSQPYHAGSDSYRLKQGTHTYTNPRPDHYLTHAHRHITRAVAHEQLFRPYWGSSAWHSRRSVTGQKPYIKEWRVLYLPAPHNTCGSCWLGTARQFSHDMRRQGGSWDWCMCAPYFNLLFENSELHCSTA